MRRSEAVAFVHRFLPLDNIQKDLRTRDIGTSICPRSGATTQYIYIFDLLV